MIINARKFGLQPSNDLEITALTDAMDCAIEHADTPATHELAEARILAWQWCSNEAPIVIELSAAALQLVGMSLAMFADWATEPDFDAEDRNSLNSAQFQELANRINAWLVAA